VLARAVAGAHEIAVDSIGRLEAINAEIDSTAAGQLNDSPVVAREAGRQLIAKNREIAEVLSAAKAAVHTKTVALKELTERYQRHQT